MFILHTWEFLIFVLEILAIFGMAITRAMCFTNSSFCYIIFGAYKCHLDAWMVTKIYQNFIYMISHPSVSSVILLVLCNIVLFYIFLQMNAISVFLFNYFIRADAVLYFAFSFLQHKMLNKVYVIFVGISNYTRVQYRTENEN